MNSKVVFAFVVLLVVGLAFAGGLLRPAQCLQVRTTRF